MTDADFLGALGGAPVSFEVGGVPLVTRRLTFAQAQRFREYSKKCPDDKPAHLAALIAIAVTRGDGAPISVELARQLPAEVAEAIADKVADVNGWGDTAKNS
ncbi:MAG TPA: hypothetical protein VGE74_30165 [Gemmata sp.]